MPIELKYEARHAARPWAGRFAFENVASRLSAGILSLCVMWVCLATQTASAQTTTGPTCTGTAETIQIRLPQVITVLPNMQIGATLTEWIYVSSASYYQCNSSPPGGFMNAAMAFRTGGALNPTQPARYVEGYKVWDTAYPGIGVAISARSLTGGCGARGWRDFGSSRSDFPAPWVGDVCYGFTRTQGGEVSIRLVKTGPIVSGTLQGQSILEGAGLIWTGVEYAASDALKTFAFTSATVMAPACSTRDITVQMGSHPESAFRQVGSTAPPVAFTIPFTGCPAGLSNGIQYQFVPTPTSPVIDGRPGVIALSPDATASGIGLQLTEENGTTPLRYNQPYRLAAYNAATGGDYSIRLNAAYYRINQFVRPGTVRADVQFAIIYP